jgi:oxygen-independent coproporphyrinogen-3 oxidase
METIDRDLLRRYDRPGPRYTSYPTVPEWSSDFGPNDYVRQLKQLSATETPLSLYFHIPFCKSRCLYCGCTTVVNVDVDDVEAYLDSLEKEMDLVSEPLASRKKIIQLHWGGGTPTFMSLPQIKKLFKSISDHFIIDTGAEMAIEVDPRVTTLEQLSLLRELGFNRISMGVQDLTPSVQKAIGRNQTAEQTITLFEHCRQLGFSGINIDLIYGLPNQSVENFAETVDAVIEMGADRVAVYSFAYLPEVKPHQKLIPANSLPLASAKYNLFATAVEKFTAAEYAQIGMDHFARPQDELAQAQTHGLLHRNFMGYTTRPASNSLGFGMSAISELSRAFAQNISDLKEYQDRITAGKLPTYRGQNLTSDDHIRQRAIMSLMCNFTLPFGKMDEFFEIDSRDYFALELTEMKQFIDDGLAEVTDSAINVLPRGRVLVRNIAMVFDAYLRRKGDDGRQAFSRTV